MSVSPATHTLGSTTKADGSLAITINGVEIAVVNLSEFSHGHVSISPIIYKSDTDDISEAVSLIGSVSLAGDRSVQYALPASVIKVLQATLNEGP